MRKSLVALAALVLVAGAAGRSYAQTSTFEITPTFGWRWGGGMTSISGIRKLETDPNISYGLSLGRRLNPMAGVDIGWMHFQGDVHANLTTGPTVSGSLKRDDILLNGTWYAYKGTATSPFFTAGAGVSIFGARECPATRASQQDIGRRPHDPEREGRGACRSSGCRPGSRPAPALCCDRLPYFCYTQARASRTPVRGFAGARLHALGARDDRLNLTSGRRVTFVLVARRSRPSTIHRRRFRERDAPERSPGHRRGVRVLPLLPRHGRGPACAHPSRPRPAQAPARAGLPAGPRHLAAAHPARSLRRAGVRCARSRCSRTSFHVRFLFIVPLLVLIGPPIDLQTRMVALRFASSGMIPRKEGRFVAAGQDEPPVRAWWVL